MFRVAIRAAVLILAAHAAALAASAQVVDPARYTIIDLGTFGSVGSETYANASGINELGHVAGVAEDDQIRNHAFLYRDGMLVDLGALNPSGTGSNGKGVNDLDQVVGQSAAPYPLNPDFTVGHPFLWTEQNGMIDLVPDSTSAGWAWGINNKTQIAFTLNAPYFWDPNEGPRLIALPNCPNGRCSGDAWEINNNSVVCGTIRDPNTFLLHAFKYDATTDQIVDLHDPNIERHSQAYGLNDLDDVVGWSELLNLRNVPVLWRADGQRIQLPLDLRPDLLEGEAEHINDLGDIVGKDRSNMPGVHTEAWVIFRASSGPPMQKIALEEMISAADRAEWELTLAFEINDSRQITGIGLHNDLSRAFLMTPTIDGDTDGDCDVDINDLTVLLSQFGNSGPEVPGDVDGDGDVDVNDLTVLLAAFGQRCF